MAILNQKRILNLIPKVSAPVTIHVSQGDVGTQIEFTLVKGDEVFVNHGNISASVHGVREDGANFGPFTCTLSGSKVTFPLHSEMTAVKGSAIAEIVLVDNGGNKVGSANFGILIEQSAFPLGVTYDNDVSVYESILAYVQTIPAQLTNDYTSKINVVQSGLNSEIAARTSEDVLINTRIDEIIAPSGEAPSVAEVTDARIGTDGTIYNSLGDSIRKQIGNVRAKEAVQVQNLFCRVESTTVDGVTIDIDKNRISLTGTATQNTSVHIIQNLMYPDSFFLKPNTKYYININGYTGTDLYFQVIYNESADGSDIQLIRALLGSNDTYEFTVPATFFRFRITLTLLEGKTYNENLFVTLTNDEAFIKNCKCNSIVNDLPFNGDVLYNSISGKNRDTLIQNGVTTKFSYKGLQLTGIATQTTAVDYITDINNDIFKIGQKVTIKFKKDVSHEVYVQVFYKTSPTSAESRILSQNADCHFTFMIPKYYSLRISIVYVNGYTYNDDITLEVFGENYKEDVYYVSDFNNSLIAATKAAIKHYGSIVIFDVPSLDLKSDFINTYGESFFTNYSTSQENGWGVEIGNGMVLRGRSDCTIYCDLTSYVGASGNPNMYFSPLMLSGDCELDNVNIIATNCRYCVHDDWYDKTESAIHKYNQCYFEGGTGTMRCIGGGLPNAGQILIENCELKNPPGSSKPINYHNCVNANAKSKLSINNNYFYNGTIGLTNYGPSTLKSVANISNNVLHGPISVGYEDPEHYSVENIELHQWNNIILEN